MSFPETPRPLNFARRWINAVVCYLLDHDFQRFGDGFKRRCRNCNREEWMFSKSYPRVGEAKYSWRHMDFDRPVEKHGRKG